MLDDSGLLLNECWFEEVLPYYLTYLTTTSLSCELLPFQTDQDCKEISLQASLVILLFTELGSSFKV